MEKIIITTAQAACKLFPKNSVRIWYVKLGSKAWKAFIIDTETKVKLFEGPYRATPKSALISLKSHLESSVKAKAKNS